MAVPLKRPDLRGAKAVGLRTAFVVRASEFGDSTTRRPDLTADDSVDVSARDFNHLATLLGA